MKNLYKVLVSTVFITSFGFATVTVDGYEHSHVINVPDDYTTIQAALTAAGTSDTVLVQPGTYTENIIWPETNGIKLISAGDSSNTIIDGGGTSSVIYMNPQTATIDTTTLIQGFKITNGGNTNITSGGGMAIVNAGMNIIECSINDNISNEKGGGIFVKQSTLNIYKSNICGNQSALDHDYWHGGGGMYIACSNVKLFEVIVDNNRAENGYRGGGLFVTEGESDQCPSNITIIDSEISNNYSDDQGGGIFITNTDNTILSNVDINNNTATMGGGMYLHGLDNIILDNVDIRDNIAEWGGGIYTHGTDIIGNVNIFNNVGSGILTTGQDVNIKNVKIFGNIHLTYGSGIIISGMYDYGVIIDSCIIVSNVSELGSTLQCGSGLNSTGAENIDISNSIIINNHAGNAGVLSCENSDISINYSTLYNNSSEDIYKGLLLGTGSSSTISNSNIYNDGNSVQNNEILSFSTATNNYWGDASGPYHPTQNTAGEGDSVNTFVNVDPWLTAPNTDAPPIPAQNVQITSSGYNYVNLSWDASAIGDLAGYKVYYDTDTTGYPYANSVDVSNVTTYNLTGLNTGSPYYIAVTTYDTDGNESWYSAEAQATPVPDTLNVPASYTTIQSALTAASEGDVVLVQSGTYTENIIWPETNGIKLISAGDSSNTIIDGGGVSSVIYMNPQTATIDTTTLIKGFKITNGGNINNGGGLYINNASIKLNHTNISGNYVELGSDQYGGGIYLNNSNSSVIINCSIKNNSISEAFATRNGGGIYFNNSIINISSSIISSNRARSGAGIYGVNSTFNAVEVSISNNRLFQSGSGGGVTLWNTTSDWKSCIIEENGTENNPSSGSAGGLYLAQGTHSFQNSIIRNNWHGWSGGGIDGYNTTITYDTLIIIGNVARRGGGISTYNDVNFIGEELFIISNQATGEFSESATTPVGIGGGINMGTGTLSGATFLYNTASVGSALFLDAQTASRIHVIDSVLIANNNSNTNKSFYIRNSNSVTVENTNFLNSKIALFNSDNSLFVDAVGNYWGHSSGPYHPTQNSTGQGDSTNTFVNVTPWLTTPDTDAPPIPAQNTTVTGTGNDFISLKWDTSPLGDLAGYKLYYDSDSSGYPYANSVDVGTDTSYTLSSLTLGTTYYLAVTTYDTDGNESWYSNEVTGTTRVMQAQSLDVGGDENLQHMVSHTPSITFGYYDSMNETQTSYQIQVSTQSDYSSADMWDSGEVTSSDTSVTYAGTTLTDGVTYYLRAKVGAGSFYSNWSTLTFRMNTEPTTPVLVSPINNQVSGTPVVLNVLNGSDAESDVITYSFNVYSDITLTTKLDSATAVTEGTDTTSWQITATLPDNGQYFWAVSTNDGYEESTVSTAASFLLNISNDAPAAFALLSPADSAEVTTITPLLDWASASDPDPIDTVRYTLYLDTPDPGVTIVSVDTATSYQVSTSLSDNTTYYWKVVANDLNGASTENTGGYHSFRVNTANDLPGDFALLSPEDGSMVTDLTPTLHWEEPVDPDDGRSNTGFNDVLADIRSSSQTNSRSITSYYVYVDTTLSLTGVIPDTVTTNSYTPAVNLLEDEMYYWKVEAVDDDGGVTSSAMWSFWTNSENSAPSAITLLTPTANEQTGLTPTFSWTASSDADLYDSLAYTLRYGTDVSNLTDVSTGTQTTYTPTNDLTDNTGYLWQVLATDLSDATYSTAFSSFIVNSANDSPDAFSLISPDSGSVVTDNDVLLFWNTAVDNDGDQLSYALYLSQDLASLTAIDTLNVNYYEATDLTEGNYYWKVTAFDELGGSTTTATWSFLINAENDAPDAFTLLSPTDDAELTTLTPSFTWHSTTDPDIGDQISYTLELGESFDSLSVAYSGSDTTFTSTTELSDNTTYYWRVIAADLSGATTYNTVGYWSFRVNTENDLPGDFALLSPDSGSMVTDLTPTLHWEEPVDPDDRSRSIVSYYVYLDTASSLIGVIPDTVTTNSYTPTSDLLEDAMYYWKVEAVDDDDGMNTSVIWSFSVNTSNSPPSAFALLSPAPESVYTTQVMYFEWESATDADPMDDVVNYSLDIHVDTVHLHYDLNTTSFTSDGLTDNSIYHWSVTAHDMNGGTTVNTGGPRMFVINTANDPPSASTLVAPLNGSIQTDLTPNFYWTEATDPDPLDHVSYTMNWWPTGVLPVIYSINTDSTGVSPDEDITDNSQFGWMVVANDMHNSQSTSDTSYFYSDAFPEPPLNFATVSPINNVEGLATEVEFVWEETDDPDPVEEISYRVVYATNWEDSSTYVYSETIENTSMVITLADNSQYYWLVEALDSDGFVVGSNENNPNYMVVGTLSIDGADIPEVFALHQNYPNPFNPITTLRYDLPENSYVNVTIYDMLGREIRTLVNSTQDAGFKSVIWNATNDFGKPVSAGVYLYQIQAGEFVQTKKMVLLK